MHCRVRANDSSLLLRFTVGGILGNILSGILCGAFGIVGLIMRILKKLALWKIIFAFF